MASNVFTFSTNHDSSKRSHRDKPTDYLSTIATETSSQQLQRLVLC